MTVVPFLRKELTELGRDRKAILFSIVLPVLINPAMFALTTLIERGEQQKIAERILPVAITGGVEAREFFSVAHEESTLRVIGHGNPDSLRARVREGFLEAWLDVSASTDSAEVRIVSHAPRASSIEAADRLQRVVETVHERRREQRWKEAGGEGSLQDVVAVRDVDVASQEESGGASAGRRVPLLLILTIFAAGSALSSDVIAGEKERGTLETLYLTPAHRRNIALSKYMVVAGLTLISGLLNVGSMILGHRLGWIGDSSAGGDIVAAGAVATTCLLVIPLAALLGGLLLGLSAYARSIKEYQVLATPVMLLALIPGLLAMSQDVPLNTWTAMLPIANVALAVRDALLGPIPNALLALVLLSSIAWGLVTMRWVGGVLSREEAILGFDPEPFLAHTASGRRRAVMVGMCMTVLAFFYAGQLLQAWNLNIGLLLSLWVLLPLLGLGVLKLAWSGGTWRNVLSLRPVPLRWLLGAACLGVGSMIPMLQGLFRLQSHFLPMPEETMKPIEDIASGGAWQVFFLLAFSPAVCEEFVFRGVFLGLLRRVMPAPRAIALSSLFFGLTHLNIFRLLPTTFLGLIMGTLVVRTGSLATSIIFHMMYNGSAVLGERFLPEKWVEHGTWQGWAISIALLLLGFLLIRGRPAEQARGLQ
ncbi:MAG TPA: ABC transporter permease subunit/CPBP intramembrane protease [bacterium]|nr:ABC transporter permease subunit/CPBP intramembrane protease [bacterium]